ncbi:MAG: hypothetical protein H6744_18215 [Deltaproteobacteria bacterium]|nr:hypothetical protein [Deltaproteobacteria bacterium]
MRDTSLSCLALLLAVLGADARAAVLKTHDFVSGTLAVDDQIPSLPGEYYAARFEAPSYPVTLKEFRFFLGDNGDGNVDCGSWNLMVWDDPTGAVEPGSIIFDSNTTGYILELWETVALQSVDLSSFLAGPITVNGPFRIGLAPEDKSCLFANPFGGGNGTEGYGWLYSDAESTPGNSFVYKRLCGPKAECDAHPDPDVAWVPLSEAKPSAGDFIMEVVTTGGDPPACSPPGCDDGDPCTTDACVGGQCQHANIPGCGPPDPPPDDAPDAESAPDTALDAEAAPDTAPDPDPAPDSAPAPDSDPAPDSAPDSDPDPAPDPAPDTTTADLGPLPDATADVPTASGLRIDSVTPARGANDVTTAILIEGQGFAPGMSARLGPFALDSVGAQTDASAVAVVPAGLTPGIYTLYVRRGEVEVARPDAFEVQAASASGCAGAPAGSGLPWLALALLSLAAIRRGRGVQRVSS